MKDESEIDPDEKLTDSAADGVDLTLIRWMLSLTPDSGFKWNLV